MNNRDKREIGAEGAALFAASPEAVALSMRYLEDARMRLGMAHLSMGRPIMGKHVRRAIEAVDVLLEALHDAGGRS